MASETYDWPDDLPITWQQMLADPSRPTCLDCGEPPDSGRVGVAASATNPPSPRRRPMPDQLIRRVTPKTWAA